MTDDTMTDEEIEALMDAEASPEDASTSDESSRPADDNVEVGDLDDDMLADMLDQASDGEGGSSADEENAADLDDDMLADMLDQASDGEEGGEAEVQYDSEGNPMDPDAAAMWGDALSEQGVSSEPELDSEGNPMDPDAAAMWGDALSEQKERTAEDFERGKKVPAGVVQSVGVSPEALTEMFGGEVQLDIIMDIPVTISMEIGRTMIPIRNLMQLNQGSVIELDRLAGEPMDVLVNGTLIAHGEVVVVNEKFGIRLTDVISVEERVKKIN